MALVWDSTTLDSSYGFSLLGEGQMESGLLSLPGFVFAETIIPGRVAPDVTLQRRDVRKVTLDCALFAADHATLLTYRDQFVNLVGDGAYASLTVTDRMATRLMVATVDELVIPRPDAAWERAWVRFQWSLRSRIPYWEDSSLQTANPVTSPLANTGDEPCPVTWTCTVTGTLASGLWFESGGERFTYSGALTSGDVLVVETELPTVTLNGTANWSNVATSALFPWLQVGDNVVTKSSSDFALKAEYRRWWR